MFEKGVFVRSVMATNIAIPSYESSLPVTNSANGPVKKQHR